MRDDLKNREKNVLTQGKRFANLDYEKQLSMLAQAESPEDIKQQVQ